MASNPLADGGTAWRSAAAHRHHTSLGKRKQVVIIRTRRQRPKILASWPVRGMEAESHVALVTPDGPASTADACGHKLGGRQKHAK